MSEMVERVAQAIYETWSSDGDYVAWVPHGNSFKQDDARREARAAILAMRDPSEEMINAVITVSCRTTEEIDISRSAIRQHWAMMIDEALK